MSLWKRYNANPLDSLRNLKNKLQICYESNSTSMAQPILDNLHTIFREIYSYDNNEVNGVLFCTLQNPENDSFADSSIIRSNQAECEQLLYSILAMEKQSLGYLMYETSQKYQREYLVPIYILPKIFVEKILQKAPQQNDSIMQNYSSTLRYGVNINHENQIKLSQDEFFLVTLFNAFIWVNMNRRLFLQKVMLNEKDLLNAILLSYLDYFKNKFSNGVQNISSNSFYKKFRMFFDDYMVNNTFLQSHSVHDTIMLNFPQEHMLRAMSNYIDFQHGILFEEFTQSIKYSCLNKRSQKFPSIYNLSMLFFNYAYSLLQNWPADNKIPILRFVELWTKFMSPLNIPGILISEKHNPNQGNFINNNEINSNFYMEKLSKRVSYNEFNTIIAEFLNVYISNSIHCYNYIFSLFLIKIAEMYQYQITEKDFESISYVLSLFTPVESDNGLQGNIFRGLIPPLFMKESSKEFLANGEYYMKMDPDYFDYKNCRLIKTKVHKLLSVLNTVTSSKTADQIKSDLRKQFDISEKSSGKLDESQFSRTDDRQNSRPSIKKYDYPFYFEGTWEEPINSDEFSITYRITLKLCDCIDWLMYDIIDMKVPERKSNTKRMMLHDDKWVPYKNEYLINRTAPFTNMRFLAKKNVFYLVAMLFVIYQMFFK